MTTVGFADVVIAATARCHGLTILTRNVRHFAPLGAAAVDPFKTLPTMIGSVLISRVKRDADATCPPQTKNIASKSPNPRFAKKSTL